MQTASFTGFIQMVIEIMLFYYVVKFLGRLFMPYIIKKAAEKVGENFQEQFKNTQKQNNYKQKDGVILDDSKVEKKPQTNNKVGEYIDFEEIK